MREIRSVDALAPREAGGSAFAIVEVSYECGAPDRYAWPARASGDEAGANDRLWPALVSFIASGKVVEGSAGVFAGRPAVPPVRAEPSEARLLTLDQSNTSVVLDERLVVKCYRLLAGGVHPEPEILAALAGSPHAPDFGGSLVYRDGDGVETVLVCLQELVAGEGGWESVIVPLVELAGAERAVREASALDAAAYAEVTAALHVALAEALGVRPATTADLMSRAAAARQQLHDAMASVPVEARPGLEAALPELESAIAGLEAATGTPLSRVHGDLHVGQFLRSGRGLVVVDFEGEPGRSLAERRRPWTPLRDLASLLLSLDHAAAAAARRVRETGGDAGYLSVWADAARAAALDAYERGIAGSGLAVDGRLLRACEAEKESAELLYAARTLPEWLYAPLEVLARRFGGGA